MFVWRKTQTNIGKSIQGLSADCKVGFRSEKGENMRKRLKINLP